MCQFQSTAHENPRYCTCDADRNAGHEAENFATTGRRPEAGYRWWHTTENATDYGSRYYELACSSQRREAAKHECPNSAEHEAADSRRNDSQRGNV